MEGLQDCASAINKTYQKLSRSMNRALRIWEENFKFSEKETLESLLAMFLDTQIQLCQFISWVTEES